MVGGGVSQPGLDGGGYPIRGVPQPGLDDGGGTQGTPWLGLDGGGYPGYPHPGMEYPPTWDGVPHPPRQSSIVSTCYAAGSMPLAFTQEDILVFQLDLQYLLQRLCPSG